MIGPSAPRAVIHCSSTNRSFELAVDQSRTPETTASIAYRSATGGVESGTDVWPLARSLKVAAPLLTYATLVKCSRAGRAANHA